MVRRFFIIALLTLMVSHAYAVDYFPSIKTYKAGNCYDDGGDMVAAAVYWGSHMDAILNGSNHTMSGTGQYWYDRMKDVADSAGWSIAVYGYTNYHYTQVCGDTTLNHGPGEANQDWYSLMGAIDDASGNRDSAFIIASDSVIVQSLGGGGGTCPNTTYYEYWYGGSWGPTVDYCPDSDPDLCDLIKIHARWINLDSLQTLDPDGPQVRFSQDVGWNDSSGTYMWPSGRLSILNYWYDLIKIARPKALIEMVTNQAQDSAVQGFYDDNCCGPAAAAAISYWHLDSSIGGATGSGWSTSQSDVDWKQIASPSGTGSETVWNKFAELHVACADTLLQAGYRTIANFCNSNASYIPDLILNGSGDVVSDIFMETRMNDVISEHWSGLQGDLARMDTLRNHPDCRNYWELRAVNMASNARDTGTSWMAHTGMGAFLAIQSPGSYYCYEGRYNNDLNDGDTMYFANFEIHTIALGDPTASTYTIVDTGTTELGDNIHMLWREYDYGGVLFLPPEATITDPADSSITNEYWFDIGGSCWVYGMGGDAGHLDSVYYADGVIPVRPQHASIYKTGEAPASGETIIEGTVLEGTVIK